MLFVYPAIFHEENESYWVDLKGCYSSGSTIPETMEMVREALTGHILTLLEHGDNIAAPSDIADYRPIDSQHLHPATLTNIRAQKQSKNLNDTIMAE